MLPPPSSTHSMPISLLLRGIIPSFFGWEPSPSPTDQYHASGGAPATTSGAVSAIQYALTLPRSSALVPRSRHSLHLTHPLSSYYLPICWSTGAWSGGFCRCLHQQGLAHDKLAIISPGINNLRTKLLALDGCKSSKATLQPPKPITQQSTMQ